MQLDIFDHSQDVMLRNDVVHALERHDANAARVAWRILGGEFPADESLPPLEALIHALENRPAGDFHDHDALCNARFRLSQEINAAAEQLLGERAATGWMATRWRELAQRSGRLAFVAARCDDHVAHLWLLGGEWSAALDAVSSIPSWRRIPQPLAWMAEARYRSGGLESAFALLAELAWLSVERFDELVRRINDPRLDDLLGKFGAGFDGNGDAADLAWFPAWVLTEKPVMARQLSEAQRSLYSPQEQAMWLLLELLGLERQGRHHDVVARRKVLRDLQPSLYAAYMAKR